MAWAHGTEDPCPRGKEPHNWGAHEGRCRWRYWDGNRIIACELDRATSTRNGRTTWTSGFCGNHQGMLGVVKLAHTPIQ